MKELALTSDGGWKGIFTDVVLPEKNCYYVIVEELASGYQVFYTGEKVQISVDGGMPMTGVKVDLTDPDSTLVTLTNAPAAKLPATGGSGTLPYTLGGSLLIAVGVALMYTILKRRREEEITP